MNKLTFSFLIITTLFSIGNLLAQSSTHSDYVPTIPADRRVDWHNVGDKEKPTSYNKIFNVLDFGANPNVGTTDDRIAIQNAIDSARIYIAANPGTYAAVYLPQGTYDIMSGNINLANDENKDYSNICLKGDGSDKTKLYFPSGNINTAIYISGRVITNYRTITAGYHKGDSAININSTTEYNIGDYAEIVSNFQIGFGHQVGQIVKIIDKTGTQLILEDKLSINYDEGSSLIQVRKLAPIKNVGIEDLIIERGNRSGMWGNTIEYNYAAKCWVLGVESYITYKYHVDIHNSTFIEIRGCYFHHATGYGNGGIGYGVMIENHSTNCLVEDNLFSSLRHSMIVQSGANRNVFGYNHSWAREWENWTAVPLYGTADISIHANYPYANLFEGNLVDMIWADDDHGLNGPYNTFIRNDSNYKIYLNAAHYSNAVGNNSIEIDVDGGPVLYAGSANVLDVAAIDISNGTVRTHGLYWYNAFYRMDCLSKDFSYYLDDFPPYFLQYPTVTWPPLGTATAVINDYPAYPGNTIPAYHRKLSGGKYTLNGPTIVNFQNNFPGQGNGGNIIVNSNQISSPTSNFTVASGNPIAASAINQTFNNVDFYFSNWSNGSQNISETFYPSVNTTYTANFIGKPANGNKNQHFNDIPGQNVIVYWDQHPNSNVTKYDIYRKVKHLGVMGPEFQIASINRVGTYPYTYSYTDYDYTVTSSYTNDLVLYDVRQYYAPTTSYSDPTFLSIFGSLEAKPNLDLTPDKITQNITENSIDNYPNPFNPSTVIRYQIVNAGHVTLKVYDALGREVITLVDKEQASGRYEVNFNTSSIKGELASGLYIYKITANDFFAVKKMILTK